jgi:phospholipid/cholesterol/gamma-HCH transport system substrate-binding protein
MEAEARYAWVGAAVLALVAALVGGLVWLQDLRGRDEVARYAIHFERQALDGLEVGAPVNLRGIKVGRVDDYTLDGDKFNRVRVVIRVDRRTPVRTNTEAVITRNIVTGIAAITLLTPEPPGPPLVGAPPGELHPVIAEGRSDLDDLAGRVQQLGDQAANALVGVNRLLTADNRRAVMDTVHELRTLAVGLNARLRKVDLALERGGRAAAEVGSAAARLAAAGEHIAATADAAGTRFAALGERAVDVVQRSGARLDGTLAQTDRLLDDARGALARLAASVEAIERQALRTTQRVEATAAGVDDQLAAVLSELRLSTEAASRVLDRLQDPRAALLGPPPKTLGPGEAAR